MFTIPPLPSGTVPRRQIEGHRGSGQIQGNRRVLWPTVVSCRLSLVWDCGLDSLSIVGAKQLLRSDLDSYPFFTALDPDARLKGSRDPLGFELLWTALGRTV